MQTIVKITTPIPPKAIRKKYFSVSSDDPKELAIKYKGQINKVSIKITLLDIFTIFSIWFKLKINMSL